MYNEANTYVTLQIKKNKNINNAEKKCKPLEVS